MSDKFKCPVCKASIKEEDCKFEYYKLGRKGSCPKCKGKIISTRSPRNLVVGKDGVAKRRFRNA